MVIVLYFFTLIANLALFWQKKNSKFLVFFTSIVILLIFCGSRNTVDLPGYLQNYEAGQVSGFQVLFYLPMMFCRNLGLDFYAFRVLYSTIALALLYVFTIKCAKNYHAVYFTYLLYLFFLDDIQIRNFIASSFFLVGAIFLVNGKKHWRIFFFIFTILASLVHESFLFYLVLLLVPDTNYQKLFARGLIIICVGLSVALFLNRNLLDWVASLLWSIDSKRTGLYLVEKTNNGPLLYVIVQSITLAMALWLKKVNNNYQGLERGRARDAAAMTRIVWIDSLAFFAIPLIIFSITFYRLLRNLILLNVLALSICCYKRRAKYLFPLLSFGYSFMWFFCDILFNNDFSRVIRPIFENNIF